MSVLTEDEVKFAQGLIDKTERGEHTAKEIYGEDWKNVGDERSFGKIFKETVENKLLRNIEVSKETIVKTSDSGQEHRCEVDKKRVDNEIVYYISGSNDK
ncbi:hypothetical protein AGMMS49959_17260 [Planctomycetales bacterium]|nr:hypothetical protein AGMMS49959_17260 [Planctomycetales bacterium]